MELHLVYKTLSYDKKTETLFPYLKEYRILLEEWLQDNSFDINFIKRYILISFWIEYRSANHTGNNFSIDKITESEYLKNLRETHSLAIKLNKKFPINGFDPKKEVKLDKNFHEMKKRRDIYFEFFSESILSIEDYLKEVGFPINNEISQNLFNFVTKGIITNKHGKHNNIF